MTITRTETFRAEATFGLMKGYSSELIPLDEFKATLREAQKQVARETKVKLSGKVTPCSIIFSGQDEESVSLSFIQYPKFPAPVEQLKDSIVRLVKILMEELDQNRVVIVFDDETLMLEVEGDKLDPGIDFTS